MTPPAAATAATGFSVVLNAVQRRWPPLAAFTKALTGQYILSGISANLYLTPPNAQAFEYHFGKMMMSSETCTRTKPSNRLDGGEC